MIIISFADNIHIYILIMSCTFNDSMIPFSILAIFIMYDIVCGKFVKKKCRKTTKDKVLKFTFTKSVKPMVLNGNLKLVAHA